MLCPLAILYPRAYFQAEGKGRGRKSTCIGRERERRWREGFGPPKNFGVAPPM